MVQAAVPTGLSVREDAAGQAAMLASQMADLLSSTQAPAAFSEADCKARRCTFIPAKCWELDSERKHTAGVFGCNVTSESRPAQGYRGACTLLRKVSRCTWVPQTADQLGATQEPAMLPGVKCKA